MKIQSSPGDPASGSPHAKGPRPEGIRGRVEAAAREHAPAPKGKGIVMMILGVAVLGALIWDFMGFGAASQAVRKSVDDGQRPVPRERPEGDAPPAGDAGTTPGPTPPSASLVLRIEREGSAVLELPPAAGSALLADAAPEERPALRAQILDGLVKALKAGADARQVFEAAARFQEGAAALPAVQTLVLRAHAALRSDDAAPAAILFLSRLPERGGALAAAALDEVIADAGRPLHVRIAAARARPPTQRPAPIRALAEDPTTHPALREALE